MSSTIKKSATTTNTKPKDKIKNMQTIMPQGQEKKKVGGRPPKKLVPANNLALKEFLSIFGLSNWDDKKNWTQDILSTSQALKKYFAMRNKLLLLSLPMNNVRKLKLSDQDNFKVKDLITLLNQIGKLYGYVVVSYTKDIKPTKANSLDKKLSYQVYHLAKIPTKP